MVGIERQFDVSLLNNDVQYNRYLDRLTQLSLSAFEWLNLPDTVNERFMELALFLDGRAVFFKDDVIGYLCLKCTIGGTLDVYNIPTIRNAIAANGYFKELNPENSVLIYNTMTHSNSYPDVTVFAEKLYNIDRIIDVNANAQKTPILITCDETQRLTMKNLYQKYDGNEPVIFGEKNLNTKGITVLKTDAPYLCDRLYTLKEKIWNEALTYIGIANTGYEKKERLISNEVNTNLGGVFASRFGRLEPRQEACRKINEMFGLNIECRFRESFLNLTTEAVSSE